jgi:hypothetical protein
MKALIFLLVSFSAIAVPPNFKFDGARKAVYVDFLKAKYDVVINKIGFFSGTSTTIEFDQKETGNAIFALRVDPQGLRLDGKEVHFERISSPGNESEYVAISEESAPGKHTLTLGSSLPTSLFGKPEIYFQMRDLWGQFLERFLPTNDEFDQYAMEMNVTLKLGNAADYTIKSNAGVTRLSDNQWNLKFPPYFNTSAVFFHLFRTSKYQYRESAYVTGSGRILPISLYGDKTQNLADYEAKALNVLAELEADYGEFAHPRLLVYAQGASGGMEYSGATESSMVSLGHELFHSYFGRGAQPGNGSSGALDEGLASWRDYDYFNVHEPDFKKGHVAGHSVYTRNTDKHSYKQGRQFFGYIDQKLKDQGGLKPFMKYFFNKYKHQIYYIEDFRREMNSFTGRNFDADFEKYLI